MQRWFISCAFLLSSCLAAGGLKPTLGTSPPSYLESFPLGTVTETEMISVAGPPDWTYTVSGKHAFVYQLGDRDGIRTFTYLFDHGVVVDVLYNHSGPHDGSTARSQQARRR